MLIVTNYAEDFFVSQLFDTDEGKSVGMSYLTRRGLDEETIKNSDWDTTRKTGTALRNQPSKKDIKKNSWSKQDLPLSQKKDSSTAFGQESCSRYATSPAKSLPSADVS